MSKPNTFRLAFTGALEDLRKDPALLDDLKKRAERVADAASDGGRVEGYIVTPLVLEESRAAVSVMATGHARNHNNKHHTLLRHLEAGGD